LRICTVLPCSRSSSAPASMMLGPTIAGWTCRFGQSTGASNACALEAQPATTTASAAHGIRPPCAPRHGQGKRRQGEEAAHLRHDAEPPQGLRRARLAGSPPRRTTRPATPGEISDLRPTTPSDPSLPRAKPASTVARASPGPAGSRAAPGMQSAFGPAAAMECSSPAGAAGTGWSRTTRRIWLSCGSKVRLGSHQAAA
jgi:hypothetical protein